jgi:hypothetical protein
VIYEKVIVGGKTYAHQNSRQYIKKILYVKASTIKKDIVELDAGEFLCDLLTDIQEQTVSKFPAMMTALTHINTKALI